MTRFRGFSIDCDVMVVLLYNGLKVKIKNLDAIEVNFKNDCNNFNCIIVYCIFVLNMCNVFICSFLANPCLQLTSHEAGI